MLVFFVHAYFCLVKINVIFNNTIIIINNIHQTNPDKSKIVKIK